MASEGDQEDTDYVELSPEEIQELKRRMKDFDDPNRYVVYSQILPQDGMRFFSILNMASMPTIWKAVLFSKIMKPLVL